MTEAARCVVGRAARRLRAEGQPFLVATVVGVRGSSYRRPGARLLIAGDRWITGSVSGGCLEGDLLRRGWWHTDGAAAALVTYDSTADDGDPGWARGSGATAWWTCCSSAASWRTAAPIPPSTVCCRP